MDIVLKCFGNLITLIIFVNLIGSQLAQSQVNYPPTLNSHPCADPTVTYIVLDNVTYQLIRTNNDLQSINNDLNANYFLCWDLNLDQFNFTPIGRVGAPFTGIFQGNNQRIDNLTLILPNQSNVGLFSLTKGAKIRNLSLGNIDLLGLENVGALIGSAEFTEITNVHAAGQVKSDYNNAGGLIGYLLNSKISDSSTAVDTVAEYFYAGGIIGYGEIIGSGIFGGGIIRSQATGKVNSLSVSGGIAGQTSGNTFSQFVIKESFATGEVSADGEAAGFVATANETRISDSYATGNVFGSSLAGFVQKLRFNSLAERSFATGDVVGTYRSAIFAGEVNEGGEIKNSYAKRDGANWGLPSCYTTAHCGVAPRDLYRLKLISTFFPFDLDYHNESSDSLWIIAYSGGVDTPRFRRERPHYDEPDTTCGEPVGFRTIHTADELEQMVTSGYYYICNDLDLSTVGDWDPIGHEFLALTGILDGGGHSLYNLTINGVGTRYNALIANVYLGEVRNIKLINPVVRGDVYTAALVGYGSSAVIENIQIEEAQVEGTVDVGTVVGSINSSSAPNPNSRINNCSASGHVIATKGNGGGLGGWVNSTNIYASLAAVEVVCYQGDCGGLAGVVHGFSEEIDSCSATGELFGTERVGGLFGSVSSNGNIQVRNSYATGAVVGDYSVGGLIGDFSANWNETTALSNSYSIGKVTANISDGGGLIGKLLEPSISIVNSYWDIQSSGQQDSAGGEGRSTEDMTSVPRPDDTYVDWEFYDPINNLAGKWDQIDGEYPTLRGE